MAAIELEKIREICERVAGSLGLEVFDIELKGGAGKQGRTLRIFIDRLPQAGMAGGNTSDKQLGALSAKTSSDAAENVAETSVPTASPLTTGEHAEQMQSQGGVTLEDCANVSREVSTILDVEEVVPGGEYVLEVSSPGLDRKLMKPADYQRFTGSMVKLQTREPIGAEAKSKGERFFAGRLEKFEDGRLTLDLAAGGKKKKKGENSPGKKIEIALSNVEKANLVPEI